MTILERLHLSHRPSTTNPDIAQCQVSSSQQWRESQWEKVELLANKLDGPFATSSKEIDAYDEYSSAMEEFLDDEGG